MKNRKNIIIVILLVILLLIIGYLIYDKLGNVLESESIKNRKVFDAEVILLEIDRIREMDDLLKDKKSEKILELIFDDYFDAYGILDSYECDILEDNTVSCIMNYQKDDKLIKNSYVFEKDLRRIYGDSRYINITNDYNVYGLKLDGYLNRLQYELYSDKLTKQLGYELYSDSTYQKFSLTYKNTCIGYTNEDEYFYININEVNGPKLGWYYADLETGECSYMVRQVAQYKIDKETYSYELIEK